MYQKVSPKDVFISNGMAIETIFVLSIAVLFRLCGRTIRRAFV